MKKLLVTLLTLALLLSLSACTTELPVPPTETTEPTETEAISELTEPETTAPTETQAPSEQTEPEATETTYFAYYEHSAEDVVEVEPSEDMLLIQSLFDEISPEARPVGLAICRLVEESSFEFHTTLPYEEGMEAYHCASMMGHSPIDIVLLNIPADSDMESLCKSISEKIDPKKEICHIHETTYILTAENTVLMVMGESDLAEQVQNAFLEARPEAQLYTFCRNVE